MRIIATFAIIMAASTCANVMVVGACGGRGGSIGRVVANAARDRVDRRCLAPVRRCTLSFHPNANNTFVSLDPNVGSTTAVRLLHNNRMAFVTLSEPGQRIGINGDQKHRNCYHQHQLFTPRRHRSSSTRVNDADTGEFYANQKSFPDFSSLGITSPVLLKRLTSKPLGLTRPSAVQAAVFETISRGDDDVIVGAETGSGKTLAYLMPLVEDVLKRKREWKARVTGDSSTSGQVIDPGYDYARAIILVPNKELALQAARMAASISGGMDRCVVWGAEALGMDYNRLSAENIPEEEVVRLALLPGGLSAPQDFPPWRFATSTSPNHQRQPPPDLVFATPANLGPLALSPKHINLFADVSTLVVDEADMLLDGGYIRQLNNVLMGFRRADRLLDKYDSNSFRQNDNEDAIEREDEEEEAAETEGQKKTQHVFVAATLPDYGLRSVDAYLNRKFPNAISITMDGMHNARHSGLEDGSKTIWNEIDDNKERMKRLVDVLKLDRGEVGVDGRGLKGEKVMIFLNTVKDVDGATNGLRRAGIDAVPYHAKISLEDRTSNLDKFRLYRAPVDVDVDGENNTINRKNTVPVLVCTDVASRGLDIPGVTAIVQLQFALNVVSHLHRMGRCGRAGNRDGRGIIFYGSKERELVEVVREAEDQQARMTLKQDVEDDSDDLELESDGIDSKNEDGKVQKAFSRRRGFTKKRKNQRRKALESEYDD
ncbi:hypothetical protein ACHAW5_007576 [Stephanodiscus triporus]|uniref:RNA helicase n=1 Tax=Stephanodiscus triporus TaxID=2934178 RepID=A0ABD3Q9Q4_9STRA